MIRNSEIIWRVWVNSVNYKEDDFNLKIFVKKSILKLHLQQEMLVATFNWFIMFARI